MHVEQRFQPYARGGGQHGAHQTRLRKRFHRIATVRRQQGLTLRTLSRRMGVPAKELERQENPACDLTMSQVLQWQRALQVPLADLLCDVDGTLSEPIRVRACLVRMMKTVRSMLEQETDTSMRRMAETLCAQMTEMMPELVDVVAWPSEGKRRTSLDIGRLEACLISDTFAEEALD